MEEREVANNTRNCVMVTEVGEQVNTADDAAGYEFLVEEAMMTTATEEVQPTRAAASASAWHKTYYEDPPGIDVNSATTNVSWSWNGSCVTDSWDHYTTYGWFEQSGWRKDWSSTTAWQGCSYARTTSNSHFFNGAFCVGIDTHTEYVPNQIKGEENGYYTMTWDANKWGGCNWLLSFHRSWGS